MGRKGCDLNMANRSEEVLVKVGRSGGKVEEYSVSEDATVLDVLNAAGLTLTKGERLRLNGGAAEEDDGIDDGDVITISGKVAGAAL